MNPSPSETEAWVVCLLSYSRADTRLWDCTTEHFSEGGNVGGDGVWIRGSCSVHELSDALISFIAFLICNLKWQLIFRVMAQLQDTFNYAKIWFFQLLTSVHS